MRIERGTRPTTKTAPEWFTGDVYMDGVSLEHTGINSGLVHFTPGARTNWHTHELGQTIYVIEGVGRVQREGGEIEEIRAGDTVYFEPNENHWHGATPARFMAHIAIVRIPDVGNATEWGRKVTDEEYGI